MIIIGKYISDPLKCNFIFKLSTSREIPGNLHQNRYENDGENGRSELAVVFRSEKLCGQDPGEELSMGNEVPPRRAETEESS